MTAINETQQWDRSAMQICIGSNNSKSVTFTPSVVASAAVLWLCSRDFVRLRDLMASAPAVARLEPFLLMAKSAKVN